MKLNDDDLKFRVERSFDRLEQEEYTPGKIFKEEYSWPGDWEGRTILALVSLEKATGRKAKYLDEIMNILPSKLNKKGYFGNIEPAELFDEQQVSGNSWFLRGLCEYYEAYGDAKVYQYIETIVENLLLPIKGFYELYPLDRGGIAKEGEAIGQPQDVILGNWKPSSDTGCAFIMLDGATHAYKITKNKALGELIYEMISKFMTIDLLELSLQTHATLSATRGILRYYEITGNKAMFENAEKVYSIYREEGMTENYANYNWFTRPTWTEPCAIIDSYILAYSLWVNTGKISYLYDAQNIFYNAMGYAQRPNGGFGCDSCVGAENEFISTGKGIFEAFWCCTMRGGEGMREAVESSYYADGDVVKLTFYHNYETEVELASGKISFSQITNYPIDGNVKVNIIEAPFKTSSIMFFIPECAKNVSLLYNGSSEKIEIIDGFVVISKIFKANDIVELVFDITLNSQITINHNSIKGYHTIRHGMIILGIDNPKEEVMVDLNKLEYRGAGQYKAGDFLLTPINDVIYMTEEMARKNNKQVLFKVIL